DRRLLEPLAHLRAGEELPERVAESYRLVSHAWLRLHRPCSRRDPPVGNAPCRQRRGELRPLLPEIDVARLWCRQDHLPVLLAFQQREDAARAARVQLCEYVVEQDDRQPAARRA